MVAALELFAIDGYHNTSISKIAKHAGISKGLMYNYFDSKEDLLKDVVIMSLEDALEIVEQMQSEMAGMKPVEVLRISLEMFFDLLVKNKAMWKLTLSLAMQISNMPMITKVIYKIFDDALIQYERLFQLNAYQDYKAEAKILAAQLDGIALHYIIFEETYNLNEIKNKLIKTYCTHEN